MPAMSLDDLARRTRRTRAQMQVVLDLMAAEGLVERIDGDLWSVTEESEAAFGAALREGLGGDPGAPLEYQRQHAPIPEPSPIGEAEREPRGSRRPLTVRVVGSPTGDSDAAVAAFFTRLLERQHPGATWSLRERR